jgi:hypothetical protein
MYPDAANSDAIAAPIPLLPPDGETDYPTRNTTVH